MRLCLTDPKRSRSSRLSNRRDDGVNGEAFQYDEVLFDNDESIVCSQFVAPCRYRTAANQSLYTPPLRQLGRSYSQSFGVITPCPRKQMASPYNQPWTARPTSAESHITIGRDRYSRGFTTPPSKDYNWTESRFSEPKRKVVIDNDTSLSALDNNQRYASYKTDPKSLRRASRSSNGLSFHDGGRGSLFEVVPDVSSDGNQKYKTVKESQSPPIQDFTPSEKAADLSQYKSQYTSPPIQASTPSEKAADLSQYTSDPSLTALLEETGIKEYLSESFHTSPKQNSEMYLTNKRLAPEEAPAEKIKPVKDESFLETYNAELESADENSLSFKPDEQDTARTSTFEEKELTETDEAEELLSFEEAFDPFTRRQSFTVKNFDLDASSNLENDADKLPSTTIQDTVSMFENGSNRDDDSEHFLENEIEDGVNRKSSRLSSGVEQLSLTEARRSVINELYGKTSSKEFSLDEDEKTPTTSSLKSRHELELNKKSSSQKSFSSQQKWSLRSISEELSDKQLRKSIDKQRLSSTDDIRKDSLSRSSIGSEVSTKPSPNNLADEELDKKSSTQNSFSSQQKWSLRSISEQLSDKLLKKSIDKQRLSSTDDIRTNSLSRSSIGSEVSTKPSPNNLADEVSQVNSDFFNTIEKLKQNNKSSRPQLDRSTSHQYPPVSFPKPVQRKYTSYSGMINSDIKKSSLMLPPSTDQDEIGGRVQMNDFTNFQVETSDVVLHVPERSQIKKNFRSKSYNFTGNSSEKPDSRKHVSFDDFYFSKDKSRFPPLDIGQKRSNSRSQRFLSDDKNRSQSDPIVDSSFSSELNDSEPLEKIASATVNNALINSVTHIDSDKRFSSGTRSGSGTRVASSKGLASETRFGSTSRVNSEKHVSSDVGSGTRIGSAEQVNTGTHASSSKKLGSTEFKQQSADKMSEKNKLEVNDFELAASEKSNEITLPSSVEPEVNEHSIGSNELTLPGEHLEKLSSYSEEESIPTEIDLEADTVVDDEAVHHESETSVADLQQ